MIRYTVILIFLCCVPSVSTATEPPINDTIWITTSNNVRICQLPPGASGCVAVPPFFCQEVDDRTFVILDPDGLPLRSSPYAHVTYWVGDEECSQPINSTIYNLTSIAPTRAPILWIFVIVGILLLKKL